MENDKRKVTEIFTINIIIILIVIPFYSKCYTQENFEDWLKKETQQFKTFMEERDREFAEFLKKEWKEFAVIKGISPDKVPKPAVIPVKEFEKLDFDCQLKEHKVRDFKIKCPPEKESIGFYSKPKMEFHYGKMAEFYYLNTPCTIMYDVYWEKIEFPEKFDNREISKFWSQMSKTQYTYILDQCNNIKQKMSLNDWAFLKFLDKLSNQIFPDKGNSVKLLVWFLMQKSGYDVKIGYNQNKIFLLISSSNILYKKSFIKLDNKRYYTLINLYSPDKVKNIYTYTGRYPGSINMIDLNVYLCPSVNPEVIKKTVEFEYLHNHYSISLNINKSIVDFYSGYPLTEYIIYFNAPISNESNYSLLRNLKPLIVNKTELEALNLILHFVQKSFEYKSDYEQFGEEKPLFIEETLFYPGSDCEDRAVLFAYLIRNLLNLEVVGLDYPGHIATAVKINSDINGKYVNYSNENYIVCDPTYVNANVGQCLPKYKNTDPKIITLYNSKY